MGFMIFVAVFAGWCWGAVMVARHLTVYVRRFRGLQTGILSASIMILPFAHEIYVYQGFQAYCRVYGGTNLLEPVATDSLQYDIWSGLSDAMLEHPALNHVLYVGIDREKGREAPRADQALSLSEDPAACQSAVHLAQLASSNVFDQAFVHHQVASGYCYSDAALDTRPRYLLRAGNRDRQQDRELPKVFWYPRDVKINSAYEIFDTQDQVVKSRAVQLYTRPGYLMLLLIPMVRDYGCPEEQWVLGSTIFPFHTQLYEFLDEAIVEGP